MKMDKSDHSLLQNTEEFWLQCNACQHETKHVVVTELDSKFYQVSTNEFGRVYDWIMDGCKSQLIQCKGCEITALRKIWTASYNHNEDGVPFETIEIYPPRNAGYLKAKTFYYVPSKLRALYLGSITCYNNGNYLLCAAGLRAVIEGICKDKGIKEGAVPDKKGSEKVTIKKNLEGKIYGLALNGFISLENANILHHIRFLGNYAIHELDSPSGQELKLSFDILENLLEQVYELLNKGKSISKAMEDRASKAHLAKVNTDIQLVEY